MKYHFEVFRLLQTEPTVRIEREYTEGQILGEYLMTHPKVEKRQVFAWLTEITDQLVMFEKIIVSPFHMILKPNQSIAFLDIDAKINQSYLGKLKKFQNTSPFTRFPKDNPFYAYGQTIQFIFSNSDLYPKFTRKERRKIERLICECSYIRGKKQKHSLVMAFLISSVLCITLFWNLYFIGAHCSNVAENIQVNLDSLQSVEKQLLDVWNICENEELDRAEKEVLIEEIIKNTPMLVRGRRFASMQAICGFREEGGEIWFER